MINRAPPPDRNDPAIGRMAQAAELHRLDLDGEPNVAGDSFVRYWPPNPGGSLVGGNSLGFLRWCTRSPAAPLQCDCTGGFSLTLDRAVTAPNAMIAVSFLNPTPYDSGWQIMFPGDTIYVPGGFERFWIYNADQLALGGGLPTPGSRPLGFVGFLIGTRRNGLAPAQGAVSPFYGLAAASLWPITGTNASVLFNSGKARHFALTMNTFNAGNVPVTANGTFLLNLAFSAPGYPPNGPFDYSLYDAVTPDAPGVSASWTGGQRVRQYRVPLVGGNGLFRFTVPNGGKVLLYNVTNPNFTEWTALAVTQLSYQLHAFPG